MILGCISYASYFPTITRIFSRNTDHIEQYPGCSTVGRPFQTTGIITIVMNYTGVGKNFVRIGRIEVIRINSICDDNPNILICYCSTNWEIMLICPATAIYRLIDTEIIKIYNTTIIIPNFDSFVIAAAFNVFREENCWSYRITNVQCYRNYFAHIGYSIVTYNDFTHFHITINKISCIESSSELSCSTRSHNARSRIKNGKPGFCYTKFITI